MKASVFNFPWLLLVGLGFFLGLGLNILRHFRKVRMYLAFEVITQIYSWMDLESKDFEKHILGPLLFFFFFFSPLIPLTENQSILTHFPVELWEVLLKAKKWEEDSFFPSLALVPLFLFFLLFPFVVIFALKNEICCIAQRTII